jgi:hypothetical protein
VPNDRTAVGIIDVPTGHLLQSGCAGQNGRAAVIDEPLGRAYFGLSDLTNGGSGQLCTINTRTGAIKGPYSLPNVLGPMAVDAGTNRLLITTLDLSQSVHASALLTFDATTLAQLSSQPVGIAAEDIAVDPLTGTLIVLSHGPAPNGPGTLTIIGEGTATNPRTVSAGINPGQVLLDPKCGCAVVLNYGDSGALGGPSGPPTLQMVSLH